MTKIRESLDTLVLQAKKNKYYMVLIIILVGLFAILSASSSTFVSGGNFQSMALQIAPMLVLTLGMMIPLITGGINLGLVAIANISCILMATVYFALVPMGEAPSFGVMALCILIAMGVAVGFGAFTGFLVARLRIPAMLATLAVKQLCDGISMVITSGKGLTGFHENFTNLSNYTLAGIPMCLIIAAVFVYIMSVLLRRKPLGTYFYMVGSNAAASEFSGVNVKRTILNAYIVSGICSGLAGLLMTLQFNSANVAQGDSFILKTVIIAVLGGVDPNGGSGKIFGVVIAVIILQCISSGLNLLGVTSFAQTSLWGLVVLCVMGINRYMVTHKSKSAAAG